MTQPARPTQATLAGMRVLVMGLGRFGGGVGVSQWLAGQGAVVTVTDSARPEELAQSVKALEGLPVSFKLGGHDVADFLAADLLVINPAVDRAKSDVVQAALKKGVPATTEMNLFLERCRGVTVGITGSVGKSTTTALIYEALKTGFERAPGGQETGRGRLVFLGGNIGRSLLLDLPDILEEDLVVLELSSFMLEETPKIKWSPHIAVVTNVFENHLDRHRTMAAYTAAKQNILRYQKAGDFAVLNVDHDLVSRWVHLARGKVVKFTIRGPAKNRLELAMPGEHNQSNAAAAVAVLDALAMEGISLDRASAVRAITIYPGLPHRLQCVYTEEFAGPPPRRVRYYNDSKATSPDASITALQAFGPRKAIFIVGGYDKHIDMSNFLNLLAERAAGVVGIGQTGEAMVTGVTAATGAGGSGLMAHYAGTLEVAVAKARQWAGESPGIRAIVLSPASASWDQYANYEKRGAHFSDLSRQTGVQEGMNGIPPSPP